MERKKGLVSFLIPCYNHELYIKDCLNSILKQDYKNYEVLITDDCSSDNSAFIIRNYKRIFDDNSIRFEITINDNNCGVVKNINRMLEKSQGEFIKVFASDDILDKKYLQSMVHALNSDKKLMVVFSNGYSINEKTSYPVTQDHILEDLYTEKQLLDSEDIIDRIYTRNTISAPAALVRYELYEKIGVYDESFQIEDYDMWLRALEYDKTSIEMIDEHLVYYRKSDKSLSALPSGKTLRKKWKFYFDNELRIAKKHKTYVAKSTYIKKIRDLYWNSLVVFIKSLLY